MSFAQRFAAQRSSAQQNEEQPPRRMIPMGGGGGGPSEAIFEPRQGPSDAYRAEGCGAYPRSGWRDRMAASEQTETPWTEVGGRRQGSSAFSRTERTDRGGGRGYADYKRDQKAAAEAPKPLRMDDEEAFPSLGAKPAAKAAPKVSGFAALASSWAAQDEAVAAEERRRQLEDEEARLKRERENRSSFLPRIFRSGGGGAVAHSYNEPERYSPHSPTYDPYSEDEGAEPYEEGDEPMARNAILEGGDEDDEGWTSR